MEIGIPSVPTRFPCRVMHEPGLLSGFHWVVPAVALGFVNPVFQGWSEGASRLCLLSLRDVHGAGVVGDLRRLMLLMLPRFV
jgi:hypothetical protein